MWCWLIFAHGAEGIGLVIEVSKDVLSSSVEVAIVPLVELEAGVSPGSVLVFLQDPVHPHPFLPHLLAGPPVALSLISFQLPVSAEGLL